MPSDISADVAYIGGIWCEGVLYGIHLIVFGAVCSILLGKSYLRRRVTSSMILLAFSVCMFVLSTVHVALGLSDVLHGFIDQVSETPQIFFRQTIFPLRKAIYIVNTLLGDSLLVWRVYVIWRRDWRICTLPALFLVGTAICGVRTMVANAHWSSHSVFSPNILSWVTSMFALNIATQVTATALIAGRIYRACTLGGAGTRYMSIVWLVVESGAIYTSAALVQLITYLARMNAGVILELMMAQLSAITPAVIVIRIGLGFAYQGNEFAPADDVVLTTFHDTMPDRQSQKSVNGSI